MIGEATLVSPDEARTRGWGATVPNHGDAGFERLAGIHPTLNIAKGQRVVVSGKVYDHTDEIVTEPKWYQDPKGECFDAFLDVAVPPGKAPPSKVKKQPIGIAWLAFEKEGGQYTLVGLDIIVDDRGRLYCLARYAHCALLYVRAGADGYTCITCPPDRVVCGIRPRC